MAQLNYSFRVPNKSITFCELLSSDGDSGWEDEWGMDNIQKALNKYENNQHKRQNMIWVIREKEAKHEDV